MAGLSSFSARTMRDCGIGQKIWRDFGIEKKSGSGLAQKTQRDYGKSTKILRDSGIKIVSGSGIETNPQRDTVFTTKLSRDTGFVTFLLYFFLVTELINLLFIYYSYKSIFATYWNTSFPKTFRRNIISSKVPHRFRIAMPMPSSLLRCQKQSRESKMSKTRKLPSKV